MRILRGYFQTILATLDTTIHVCEKHTQFVTIEGDVLPLKSNLSIPFNELLEVFVENDMIIHYNLLVVNQRDNSYKSIALMRVLAPEQIATNHHWKQVTDAARRLEIEYKRLSKGLWDVSVTPYVVEGYTGPRNVSHARWGDLRGYVDDSHNYLHGWGGTRSGICGHAVLNGYQAWTFENCGIGTIIHEQGHNFGLHHSGTPTAEYGEPTWMGSAAFRHGFHAPHQDFLSVIDPDSIYQLSANSAKTLYLINPDSDPQSRMPDMWKGVFLPAGFNNTLMISVFRNSIRLHRAADGRTFSRTLLLAELQNPGDIYAGSHDTPGIEYVDTHDGVYKIKVRWNNTVDWPTDREWPIDIYPDDVIDLDRTLSGIYYDPDIDGQGFDLYFDVPGHEMIGYWYTYADNGNQVWYFLDGDTIYNTARGSLEPVGKYHIYANPNRTLRFSYVINDVRSVIDLIPLAYQDSGFLAEFNGKNLSGISAYFRDDRAFGYIYQVLEERTPIGIRRSQQWLYYEDGRVYLPKGGAFRVDIPHELKPHGDIELHENHIILNNEDIRLNFLI